jgi:hypothetical protein
MLDLLEIIPQFITKLINFITNSHEPSDIYNTTKNTISSISHNTEKDLTSQPLEPIPPPHARMFAHKLNLTSSTTIEHKNKVTTLKKLTP